MKKITITIYTLLLFFTTSCSNAQTEFPSFLPGFEEIPLQENLYVDEENSIIYDTLQFKIVETYVYSDELSKQQFTNFYDTTLAQLGFTKTSVSDPNSSDIMETHKYMRDQEALAIDIMGQNPLIARFTLTPVSN